MKVKLTDITIDPAVAIREGTDEDTIQRYMDNFDELPPIILYQTDHKYLLADGFHRWAAATRLGHEDIEAEIHQGTYAEASEFAIFANLKHGKPLSREEYKTAVRRLKLLHPDWGWERLSKAIQRSEHFIRTVQKSDDVARVTMVTLDDRVNLEISRAPQEIWPDIAEAVHEQGLTVEETAEKVREIKTNPESIDEILALKPPEKKEPEEQFELKKLQVVFPQLSNYFTRISIYRAHNRLTREFLRPYAPSIYSWRDSINEMVNILED